jgi:hypothetical protein
MFLCGTSSLDGRTKKRFSKVYALAQALNSFSHWQEFPFDLGMMA